jgi:hypothetical protein
MRPALQDFGAIETPNTSSTHRLFQRDCSFCLHVLLILLPTLEIADKQRQFGNYVGQRTDQQMKID